MLTLLAEDLTSPTSSIVTKDVVEAFSELAGDFSSCMPFALLEARRYFAYQQRVNPSDSDENAGRKLACEAIARKIVARTPIADQYSLLSKRFTVIESDGDESLPLSVLESAVDQHATFFLCVTSSSTRSSVLVSALTCSSSCLADPRTRRSAASSHCGRAYSSRSRWRTETLSTSWCVLLSPDLLLLDVLSPDYLSNRAVADAGRRCSSSLVQTSKASSPTSAPTASPCRGLSVSSSSRRPGLTTLSCSRRYQFVIRVAFWILFVVCYTASRARRRRGLVRSRVLTSSPSSSRSPSRRPSAVSASRTRFSTSSFSATCSRTSSRSVPVLKPLPEREKERR